MFDLSKLFKKSSEGGKLDNGIKEALKSKYNTFQKLLSTNNQVLELMADMEGKLSGEYFFNLNYIHTNVRLISDEVLKIIENLNALSQDKYILLYDIHNDINTKIQNISGFKLEIPVCDLTIPLENLNGEMVGIAGGKIAHLGEIKNRLMLPAPDGFVISSYAFIKFMEHNRLSEKINNMLLSLSIQDIEAVNATSQKIHDLITMSEIPGFLQKAIVDAYHNLCNKIGEKVTVSVRSSAVREDSRFSFAGQFATFLNVPGDLILQKYKEVVASLFTPRAIFYYKTKGFSEGEMVMAVGVLTMIDTAAGGVMYTKDPNNPEEESIIVNAIYGSGKWLEDGRVTPDIYTVSRYPEGTILKKKISNQKTMLIMSPSGSLNEDVVPDEMRKKQCIADEQIKILAKYALELERHYGSPQDIEWAIGKDNQVYILQSRPLRIFDMKRPELGTATISTQISSYNMLLNTGVIACRGVGYGKAVLLQSEDNLKDFPEGAVLVAQHTSLKFVTVMNKASAIVTDIGSATGHMASLAREYQVPTILDTEKATHTIKDGQELTVDAIHCAIYEGKVSELLEYEQKKKEPFKDTHLYETLLKSLDLIVPLNLIDPGGENFKAELCKTFHDITRFAHETAMYEMFSIGESQDVEGIKTVNLEAGLPFHAHILDIEGGLRKDIMKVTMDDILSIPFHSFLNGMKNMKWPEPKAADLAGFLGMMAHAASIPEDLLCQMGEKSFCVLSENYMNFSIRLGYHFSMVEAYAGENINDNYIKFFFKGGGATLDRRLRRVKLITEILKNMGFKINVKEDVINATLTKYKQSSITEKLEILGRLTVYTKQLDMVLFNDAITDMYIEDFINAYLSERL